MNTRQLLATLFFIPVLIIPQILKAQDNGFIYGKVTTVDGKEYLGAIRWGIEEVFWTDMFNASKEDNDNLKYLSRRERDDLDDQVRDRYEGRNYGSKIVNWVTGSWSSNDKYDHLHQFSCQFGEIKHMETISRSRVHVTLRNGEVVEVNGNGYNDIGSSIKVLDGEIGEVRLSWSRIEEIEFLNTPRKLEEKFGDPLYGKVETDNGDFEGFIQWDHDERVDTDKLDGDTYDGELSIEFKKVASIEKSGNRSDIVLQGGREFTLRGSNDVNSKNRGIIISNEKFGRVDVPWDEFRKVTFIKQNSNLKSFSDFSKAKELKGTVRTKDGETMSGRLIYDLDETSDIEVLQGKDDDMEYVIPFSKVKKISPKNYDYSRVTLSNGDVLTLGETADVSDRNSGVLVFKGSSDPTYIPWREIESVTFE